MKLYKAVMETTEISKVICTVYAKNAKEARKKLTAPKPWTRTHTEIKMLRVELDNWKIIVAPRKIKGT